jgi:hypothetical protein
LFTPRPTAVARAFLALASALTLDPGVNPANDLSVRRALEPLLRLARKYHCVVILVRHLNKRGSGHAAYRGAHSIAFLALCRSTWLVSADPHIPSRRVFAEVKKNQGPAQPSLAYELVGPEGGMPTVSWLGACEWTEGQLHSASGNASPYPTPRDFAHEFLTSFLAEGGQISNHRDTESTEKTYIEID